MKNLYWSLSLIKLEFRERASLLKKTPTQTLSCEIFKLFKNILKFFKIHLKRNSNTGILLNSNTGILIQNNYIVGNPQTAGF